MAHFLSDSLVNQNVGIDRHTNGQNDTRETGQGQNRTQRGQNTEDEEHIGDQGHIGRNARLAVVENHIGQNDQHGHYKRPQTCFYRLFAERGTDHIGLNDSCRSGQLTRFEDVG